VLLRESLEESTLLASSTCWHREDARSEDAELRDVDGIIELAAPLASIEFSAYLVYHT